jgi:hypothetical protein
MEFLRAGFQMATTAVYSLNKVGTRALEYSDAKVANRYTKVWHGASEKGP